MSNSDGLKVISLFSGAGGMDIGFKAAGFEIAVCVESDPACADTLRRNMPTVPVLVGDIRNITTIDILRAARLKPLEAALVVGGPPCQPFSLAGKREGLFDPRGTLFMEFVRVIREAVPAGFVMENVKGLLNWNKGQAMETILSEFSKPFDINKSTLQYTVVHRCLNAVNFGVPQQRERVFIIGSRSGIQFQFPEATHRPRTELMLNGKPQWRTVSDALEELPPPSPPSAAAQRVSRTILKRHEKLGFA